MTALAAYETALRTGTGCWVRGSDGACAPLPVRRWLGEADRSDDALLDECVSATLDIGCGPGRLTVALARRGVPAVGIDVSAEAVRQVRRRGGTALRRDVFGPLPREGGWGHVLLADGNIGIGGNPVSLLARVGSLLQPDGTVVVELDPPGTGLRRGRLQLEGPGRIGGSFDWAWLAADLIAEVGGDAGLAVRAVRRTHGRWIAVLGSG